MASPMSYGSVEFYYDEVLGIGSYGKVCKAKYGQLPCAAKLLHDTLFQDRDPGSRRLSDRFLQECQFLSTIKHPNIVQYLGTDSDPQSGRPVLLMELMDESLTRYLERLTGSLFYHSQLNICHDVALALAHLHSSAIIHRDLCSNNVLLIGEGSRAKVADFGMSKLVDMNPRATPLTQVPGTPAYMPPEALTIPPHYSSKLDCFSHGVLTLQIITRNFPDPGDANRWTDDPKYPSGRALVQYPETDRRKEDIDLIDPSHPLLPIALDCLKDRDTERLSADDLCGRLASLKREPRYTRSVEISSERLDHQMANEELRKIIAEKDEIIHSERLSHQRANEELQKIIAEKEEIIQKILKERDERLQEEKQVKGDEIRHLRVQIDKIKADLKKSEKMLHEVQTKETPQRVDPELPSEREAQKSSSSVIIDYVKDLIVPLVSSDPLRLKWREGVPLLEKLSSIRGAAVVSENTIYISNEHNVYSYIPSQNEWTILQPHRCSKFGMMVQFHTLTSIGGCIGENPTNSLYSLIGNSWSEVLPPMPTKRMYPAVVNITTHLVVAGGRQEYLGNGLATVEILKFGENSQWFTASNLPLEVRHPEMMTCNGYFYLSESQGTSILSSSEEDLFDSSASGRGDSSVWTRLADIPKQCSSLATLKGYVLAIGGVHMDDEWGDNTTGAIHRYDETTMSWSVVVGEMLTPRSSVLAAVLPGNELVVMGGNTSFNQPCDIINICSSW